MTSTGNALNAVGLESAIKLLFRIATCPITMIRQKPKAFYEL